VKEGSPATGSEGKASTGVQELIDRIRGEAVEAGRDEAGRIRSGAEKEAEKIKAAAREEARAIVDAARAEAETFRTAGMEALKTASRDTLLELRGHIRKAFEKNVECHVCEQTKPPDFIRDLVLILAGDAAEKYIKGQAAEVFVSSALAGGPSPVSAPEGEVRDLIRDGVLRLTTEMLREGVVLLPDDGIDGGARVRIKESNLEIDLTDRAISKLLLKYLLPRYQAIIEDEEGT
jgi:V/A-type H+-transporting ATPase subunit E